MSKLLFNSHPLVINPDLAAKIGLNESIVIQQINYWLEINKKANRNFKDGYYWTFNSYTDWKKQFPFFSDSTIRRTISRLENAKLVVSGNYNKLSIDRTKWYRIDDNILEELDRYACGQNEQINWSLWTSHLAELTQPIPETYTETNSTETNTMGSLSGDKTSVISFLELTKQYSMDNDAKKSINYYLSTYKRYRKKDHPSYKLDQWRKIISGWFYIDREEYKGDVDINVYAMREIIDIHFMTKYKTGDYSIGHFMSGDIRTNRFHEWQRSGECEEG